MASSIIRVLGLLPGGKVPGAKLNVNYGKGRTDPSAIQRYLLLMGNAVKTAATGNPAGTCTPGVVYEITADVDVDALFGPRSELARMCKIARLYSAVRIMAIAVAEVSSGSPVAATATITIATNAGSNGTWRYWIGGELVSVDIASGQTPTQQATAIKDAINAKMDWPAYASSALGVVTVIFPHVGPRGNDLTIYQDVSAKPSGSTSTLGTASAYTVQPGPDNVTGVRLAGGSATADDVTDALAALGGRTFFTIAAAQTDSSNITKLKTYNDQKAALGSQRYEHLEIGHNGLLGTGQTLTASINKERFQVPWHQGSESLPCELAASMGALRTLLEQQHPNRRFNDMVLLGIKPQRALADRPSEGETGTQQSALDSGLTPITSTTDGDAVVIRAITTKHFKTVGGIDIDFYGTLDCGQARAPDMFAELVALAWSTEFSPNNEYVDDDPKAGEPNKPTGVATPRVWTGYVQVLGDEKIAANWFTNVTVSTVYDPTEKMLLTQISVEPTPLNHRLGGNIDQVF
jgi:phage tail sheath gpL-like